MSEFLDAVRSTDEGHAERSKPGNIYGFAAKIAPKKPKCVLKCVPHKENAVDSLESTAFFVVEDGGFEP